MSGSASPLSMRASPGRSTDSNRRSRLAPLPRLGHDGAMTLPVVCEVGLSDLEPHIDAPGTRVGRLVCKSTSQWKA